ncbi:MAG: MBL fold metallo-hydrolase [Longimicrobiaceae bacterium]
MEYGPRLTILDVGHGNSAVLQTTSSVVVIDAGNRNTLLEFLRQQQINRVNLVLISHADQDHIEGLLAILSSGVFEIGQVRLNSDSMKGTAIWDDLLYELNNLHQEGTLYFEPLLTSDPDGIFNEGTIRLEVLAPSRYLVGKGAGSTDRAGRRLSTNSISAVIRLMHNGDPVALLPGDIDQIGLDHLVNSHEDGSAPVLVFPHHGGRSGDMDTATFAYQLCELVRPDIVIFSIGRNKFTNPQPEVVKGVQRSRNGVWIACTQLSKQCAADVTHTNPAHLAEAFADGKQGQKCCVGSFVINLNPSRSTMLPIHDAHQQFISRCAPTALCRRARIDDSLLG